MHPQINLTFSEALQLAALMPCLFLVLYLLASIKNKRLAIVPVLYFISIAAGLVQRLLPVFSIPQAIYSKLSSPLMFMDSFIPALGFLLIVQMAFNNAPSLLFWSVLLVPTIAITPFIYAFSNAPFVCVSDIDICFSSSATLHLSMAVVSSFIFMLLVVVFSRRSIELEGDMQIRRNKYWLIMCLIIYHLVLAGIDIGSAAELVTTEKFIIAKAVIKIAFIYMVMTSIFRVFSDQFDVEPLGIKISKTTLTPYETSVGTRAEKILKEEKIYRELGFNRAGFAKKLGVREHVLSRIINMYFNKSFSELANEYRVSEAKSLLTTTNQAVTAIAYDVGFSSITSFNRVFKELTGKSASDYRATHKTNASEQEINA